eukprot:CAMPEP_0194299106 /NCGR_PEP_ID=MMETSP0169-20130528/60534_1 /TAXON_ID=218684 /ORGANISM="Corethron pennatum, Strain L29A3" /LENGTH=643 /DNA_ID=CAMNT_0039049169 /DNA_START=639 /DNA_END=2567 /DNA_ORIENTATION=-
MAVFLNDTDEVYVEEDVLYSLMDPIPPTFAMENAANHSISVQHAMLLDIRPKPEIVPYGIEMVKASRVSAARIKNMKVCIIDTGYTYDHKDLPKTHVTGYSGPLNRFTNWKDDGNGHGTHVAGIIAALKNDIGAVGINPAENMSLHIIRIFNDEAKKVWASDVIASVQECVDAGSNVINMSLGRPSGSKGALQTEIDAYKKFLNEDNVIVVAAAGNTGDNTLWYPAAYDDVISVAGVTTDKERGYYSCHNSKVDIAAPGSNIFSTWKYGRYNYNTGTSMAAPHVAGVAALVWSHFKEKSAIEIKESLFSSAKDVGSPGRDNYFGHGLVNAKAAYNILAQGDRIGRGAYRNDSDFKFKFRKRNRKCGFLNLTTKRQLRRNNNIYQAMKILNNKCFRKGSDGYFVYERCKKSCFTIPMVTMPKNTKTDVKQSTEDANDNFLSAELSAKPSASLSSGPTPLLLTVSPSFQPVPSPSLNPAIMTLIVSSGGENKYELDASNAPSCCATTGMENKVLGQYTWPFVRDDGLCYGGRKFDSEQEVVDMADERDKGLCLIHGYYKNLDYSPSLPSSKPTPLPTFGPAIMPQIVSSDGENTYELDASNAPSCCATSGLESKGLGQYSWPFVIDDDTCRGGRKFGSEQKVVDW